MFPLLGMIKKKNWGKSSKSHRLNYQEIIIFGIFPWFSLKMFQNDWKSGKPVEMWRKLMIQTMIFWWFWVAFLGIVENPMIFWWFKRWFFDDLGKPVWGWFFEKTEGNHQNIIDWIIKKSSILGFSLVFIKLVLQNDWKIPKSMIFWWFNRWFFDDLGKSFWGWFFEKTEGNHQKIIDWIIKKSSILGFSLVFIKHVLQNDWKIPKSMIFWWFNRWFFDDFPQFFQKITARKISPNHQRIIDWIIKKLSILEFPNHFATWLMKTKGKSQNRWFFDDSIDDFLMISLSFFKKSSPERFPQIIKKSSIESSKNYRFWWFPNHFATFFNEN